MAEITAASQEQSGGIEQINRAVTQMDEATQQNSALVEEASAAAQSMKEQAVQLARAVAVFKLDEGIGTVAIAGEHADTHEAETAVRPQLERRGPGRASNVTCLPEKRAYAKFAAPKAKAAAAGGGADQWEEF